MHKSLNMELLDLRIQISKDIELNCLERQHRTTTVGDFSKSLPVYTVKPALCLACSQALEIARG